MRELFCKVFDKRIKDGWFLGKRYLLMLCTEGRFIEIRTTPDCFYNTTIGEEAWFKVEI